MLLKIEKALASIDRRYINSEGLNYEKMVQFELYHQIRLQNIEGSDLTPEFKKESKFFKENPFNESIGQYIPDLLIHSYNNKENQNVAIEVKSIRRSAMYSIWSDIKKLMCYCHAAENALNYKIGILILYDGNFIEKAKRAKIYKSKILDLFNYAYNPVEIWVLQDDHTIKKYNKGNIHREIA